MNQPSTPATPSSPDDPDDGIVLTRRAAPKELPAWSSVAPSGRPWRLRPATGLSRSPGEQAFDEASLPGHGAWEAAWSQVVDRQHGYDSLRGDAILAPLRPALAAALPPFLEQLAEQHHLARNDALTDHPTPYGERTPAEHQQGKDARAYQRSLAQALTRTVDHALNAGLFDTVLETLAHRTAVSPEPPVFPRMNRASVRPEPPVGPTVSLWDKLPPQKVGTAVLLAALGNNRYDRIAPEQVVARMNALADGPVADAFWTGWARQVENFTDDGMESLMEHDLAMAFSALLATLTRRADLIGIGGRMINRLATSQGFGSAHASTWRQFGVAVGAALKHESPRFGEAADALFGIAPTAFWMGVRSEVLYSSKMGRWINAQVLAPAQANPSGPEAQALCYEAWLNLDRKQILDLEVALPGLSREHLPFLAQDGARLRVDRADLSDLVAVGETTTARWAQATFRRAGAPLDDSHAFTHWAHANPTRTVDVLLALYSKLEGDLLKKTFREETGEDRPRPVRKAPPRRL